MTQPAGDPRQFTLHVSVALRWWLRHLPDADRADRFLHEQLSSRALQLVAVDTLPLHVLDEIARDLGDDLDPFLAQKLANVVLTPFARLQAEEILRLVPHRTLVYPAMLATSRHRVSMLDAATIALAQDSGWPLLVADWVTYGTLQAIRTMEPTLSVAWLPDQLDIR